MFIQSGASDTTTVEKIMKPESKFLKKINKIKNLKFFIAISIIFACLIPLFVVGQIIEYGYVNSSMKEMVAKAKGQCSIIVSDMEEEDYLYNTNSERINAKIEQLAYAYSARIIVVDKNLCIVKDNYFFEDGKINVSGNILKAFSGKITSNYNYKNGKAYVTMPIKTKDGDIAGAVSVTMLNDSLLNGMEYVDKIRIAVEAGFTMIICIIAFFVSYFLSEPAVAMKKSIQTIADGDKKSRVTESSISEYKNIADAVNTLLDKLDTIDKSRDEFVSNVSHELKTPMTSIKVLADSLLSQNNAPVEVYREFLQDIVDEIDRENKIISDLLNLVKTDQTGIKLNIENVNINEMMELVLKRLKPIANDRKIELILENIRPVAAEVDRVKFILVITNIVENAIKYNVDGGYVKASVNADHKYFYINVSDSGIGIPENCKEEIFERFYRVDKARHRETGGTGLGLSITKNIVMLHKGVIKYYSKENEGTTFTVRVPLTYAGGGN